MCAPDIPAPPPPPDYAAANRTAIETDIETLPMRRLIEAQARMGTGQFQGLGDVDLANALLRQQLEAAPEVAARYLDLQREYGVPFAQEARRQLEATDPEGFRLRQQFGDQLMRGQNTMESLLGQVGTPSYERISSSQYPSLEMLQNPQALSSSVSAPSLIELSDPERLNTTARARSLERMSNPELLREAELTGYGRNLLERQIYDDLARAGTMDPALKQAAEQAARARGAATGNILGDSAALEEALSVQLALRDQDNARRQAALSFLGSGQSETDLKARLGQQNLANLAGVVDQRNQAALGETQQELSVDEARNRAIQQNIENMAATVAQRNQARQSGFQNQFALDEFNNRNRQQNFQNEAAALSQRNSASQQAFANVMDAINQRNQAAQAEYSAQTQNVGQRAGARQQDLANIQSFLGLQPIVSQGGQLAGLQQGAAPFMTGQYQGANINPNAGAQGAAFAQNIFGQQSQNWGTQAGYAAQGGLLNTLGRIANVGAGLGSAYSDFNCHVAREIYGENNPKWVKFYFWKEDKAPWWFRMAYNKWSKQIASAIKPFPKLKAKIRAWMDGKINTESKTYG